MLDVVLAAPPAEVDFYEIAPENWMTLGGRLGQRLCALSERVTLICHGLSLSIGSTDALDENLVLAIKQFMHQHGIRYYSEHLSYCSHAGHLYDLLPLPFTAEAVEHVATRIRRVQDLLEQRIAIENISYYVHPGGELSESVFLTQIAERADCDILLDVNNVYVNSVNHGDAPETFLDALPAERIAYLHVAGHYREAPDLIIDTHGTPVIDPVWALLERAYARFGVRPTVLERDFNLPPLPVLLDEVRQVRALQQRWSV